MELLFSHMSSYFGGFLLGEEATSEYGGGGLELFLDLREELETDITTPALSRSNFFFSAWTKNIA